MQTNECKWRVDYKELGHSSHWYVVRGYRGSQYAPEEIWHNSWGASDFKTKESAEGKANELNAKG